MSIISYFSLLVHALLLDIMITGFMCIIGPYLAASKKDTCYVKPIEIDALV